MRLTKLSLTHFRNLEHFQADIAHDTAVVALIGPNGAGKTSVLEALSLLSPGRGLHKAKYEEMVQHGAPSWGIYAELQQPETDEPLTIGQQCEKKERKIRIDGTDAPKQAALSHVGSVLWLTPRQDRLFLDGPAPRRDFLDRLVFGLTPSHAEAVSRYKHHTRNRLRLLQDHAATDWLEIEEEAAASAGIEVLQNRQMYLQQLADYQDDTTLTLSGATLSVLAEDNPVAALQGKFERSRERDALVGATHTGPQKVDMVGTLTVDGHAIPLGQCSSGQHKRALIHILLAHVQLAVAKHQQAPLVLIDEVAAHLDDARRTQVLTALTDLGAQVWVTETEVERLGGVPAQVIAI